MKGTLKKERGKWQRAIQHSNTFQALVGIKKAKDKSKKNKTKQKKTTKPKPAAPTIQYFNITKIKPSKAILSWKA